MLLAFPETDLTVTFYESEARLRSHYTKFVVNAVVLRALGAVLLFDVDGTDLGPSFARASPTTTAVPNGPADDSGGGGEEGRQAYALHYSCIMFNFPQTGQGTAPDSRCTLQLLHLKTIILPRIEQVFLARQNGIPTMQSCYGRSSAVLPTPDLLARWRIVGPWDRRSG